MTKCKQYRHFAYTPVFDKPLRIAQNDVGHGFGHFFEEMRLNQVGAENQCITIQNYKFKIQNWHLHMAKQTRFVCFCTLFDVVSP